MFPLFFCVFIYFGFKKIKTTLKCLVQVHEDIMERKP